MLAEGTAIGALAKPLIETILIGALSVGPKKPQVETKKAQEVHEPWRSLAECESNRTWDINTGNGFYGGIQFTKRSWDWVGGQEFAEYPHQATKWQQIEAGERLLSLQGWKAWPACSKKIGLR